VNKKKFENFEDVEKCCVEEMRKYRLDKEDFK